MPVAPFVVTHTFAAPRARVYALYSEPRHIAASLSGEGTTLLRSEVRFEVGGTHHYGTRGPGDVEMWGLQRYLAIVPGERIELLQSFANAQGDVAPHPMVPTWPLAMHATTTFADTPEGHTLVTVTWVPHEADVAAESTFDAAREGMKHGFGAMLAKFDAYLASLPG